jgi:hypothetical protein
MVAVAPGPMMMSMRGGAPAFVNCAPPSFSSSAVQLKSTRLAAPHLSLRKRTAQQNRGLQVDLGQSRRIFPSSDPRCMALHFDSHHRIHMIVQIPPEGTLAHSCIRHLHLQATSETVCGGIILSLPCACSLTHAQFAQMNVAKEAAMRCVACLPYVLPMMDSLKYGSVILHKVPLLALIFQKPIQPFVDFARGLPVRPLVPPKPNTPQPFLYPSLLAPSPTPLHSGSYQELHIRAHTVSAAGGRPGSILPCCPQQETPQLHPVITHLHRVWGLGFRVQGSGFRVQGSGFRV